MTEVINFNGENLLLGNIGSTAVALSFVFSLLAFLGFYFKEKNDDEFWGKFGRVSLFAHIGLVITIFVTLYSLIHGHHYEYQYVWKHSSNDLPWYYMISCFWEGQEGSFLLWMFWHSILALIIFLKPTKLSWGAISVVMLVQTVLASMLLGIEFWGIKIGSSPFALLRDIQPEILDIPDLQHVGKGNYLSLITDGSGMSPLLQNYWMIIHPPVLFLGFAATTIPFSYMISSFWEKDRESWIRPMIPWSLLSVLALGAGIMMGAFWAYESLTFGGFWAWDPVENASLMPWILMVAVVHLLVILKNTCQYKVLTILLVCFSYFLVLYATFLTRSSVLISANVNTFKDLGLSGQLLLLILLFILMSVYATINDKRRAILFIVISITLVAFNLISHKYNLTSSPILNSINLVSLIGFIFWWAKELSVLYPAPQKEDAPWTREFWMFIGSLVLMLSAFQIIFYTSVPVFNKLFDLNLTTGKPEFYNKFQMPFVIIIAFLTGLGQLLNYRHTDKKTFWKHHIIIISISAVVGILLVVSWKMYYLNFGLLLILAVYSVTANAYYLIRNLRAKISLGGASIAHIGFMLMLIGILVSSVNKEAITKNNIGRDFIDGSVSKQAEEFNRSNMLLAKGDTVEIGDYLVLFDSISENSPNKYFHLDWMKKDKNGNIAEQFTLKPRTQNNPKMGGLLASPDIKHYFSYDIFTHINHESGLEKPEEYRGFKRDTVKIKTPFITETGNVRVTIHDIENFISEDGKLIRITAFMEIQSLGKSVKLSSSMIINTETNRIEYEDAESNENGFMGRLLSIVPSVEPMELVILTAERKPIFDYIIVKAVKFPWINLLWSGTIIMVLGTGISISQRIKELRKWNLKN